MMTNVYKAAGGGGELRGPGGGEDSVGDSTVQQIKESDRETLKSTTKVGSEPGDGHEKKQLWETSGDKVEVLTTSECGDQVCVNVDAEISPGNMTDIAGHDRFHWTFRWPGKIIVVRQTGDGDMLESGGSTRQPHKSHQQQHQAVQEEREREKRKMKRERRRMKLGKKEKDGRHEGEEEEEGRGQGRSAEKRRQGRREREKATRETRKNEWREARPRNREREEERRCERGGEEGEEGGIKVEVETDWVTVKMWKQRRTAEHEDAA